MAATKSVTRIASDRLRSFGRQALIVFVMVLVVGPSTSAQTIRKLERRIRAVSRAKHYMPPTAEELRRFETLCEQTLLQPDAPELPAAWNSIGMVYARTGWQDEPAWLICESPAQIRGWGFYLVRPTRLPGLVLQAPHSFADLYTRNIALRFLADGTFGAAAWNTIHRDESDVAHDEHHPFTAFTAAIASVHPRSRFVQVHGFQRSKRRTSVAAAADLIVSNGNRHPAPWVRKTAVMLSTELPYGAVHLFPTQVGELGATTNVQAAMLRKRGYDSFIHLEMSKPFRMRLVADPGLRALFLKNLMEGADQTN